MERTDYFRKGIIDLISCLFSTAYFSAFPLSPRGREEGGRERLCCLCCLRMSQCLSKMFRLDDGGGGGRGGSYGKERGVFSGGFHENTHRKSYLRRLLLWFSPVQFVAAQSFSGFVSLANKGRFEYHRPYGRIRLLMCLGRG